MKIVSIVGARPQFIKCAPLSRELRKKHEEILVHTGQHYDYEMSEVFFNELKIPEPNYNLGVGSCSHGEQTGKMLTEIEKVLIKEKPACVLVYGDTNSTLAGALAAAKLQICVAHIEAGLRSHDRRMPEEINRILADHVSDLLFCPTNTAVDNLAKEGITDGVHLSGDVMVDAMEYYRNVAEKKSHILDELSLYDKGYLVVTIHRQSNTDELENLSNIVSALCETNETIIFPVHPRTLKSLEKYGLLGILKSHVIMVNPLGYLDMLKLMAHSKKILTDSGGVQKEAYLLQVPCATLRNNTEWVETLKGGWNILTGSKKDEILRAIDIQVKPEIHEVIFGTVGASERILSILNSIGNK